ncbi:MAG: 4Fe-4S binding protein, partial [Holophagales bacterium]|nr:4Fe-4S binding protein [Holophagales bacterium]
VLATRKGKAKDGSDAEVYVRELCRHCADPACYSVCLVGAFHKTPEGAVVYSNKKCIGCRYCMQACPFFVPKYEWKSVYPDVVKCNLCYENRVSKGLPTACSEACEEMGIGATTFGDYDEIVAEAKKRIAEDPDTYVDKIYGLTEVGGTTVLYISSVPFEDLGFRNAQRDEKTTRAGITDEPMPRLTWNALSKVPNVIGVGAVLLGGIWWITNRRHEVEQADAANHNDSNSQNEG